MKKIIIGIMLLTACFPLENFAYMKTEKAEKEEAGELGLHEAVRGGDLNRVRALLSAGTNPNLTDVRGMTALHYAMEGDHLEIAEALLQNDANANSVNAVGNTPLHYLLGNIGDIPLNIAVTTQTRVTSNEEEDSGQRKKEKGKEKEKEEVSKIETSQKVEVKTQLLEMLLKYDANVNVGNHMGVTPLHYAMQLHNSMVRLNDNAARLSNMNMIVQLITNGAAVNRRDSSNETPFHYAIQDGDVEMVRLLLNVGSDVNMGSRNDATPLHYAVEAGNIEIAILLLERRANVNARDINDETPLHYAARQGNEKMTRLLLESKARIDERDIHENTPAHYAAYAGSEEVISLLLSHEQRGLRRTKGILYARNINNETPLFCAIRGGHISLARQLLGVGASLFLNRQYMIELSADENKNKYELEALERQTRRCARGGPNNLKRLFF